MAAIMGGVYVAVMLAGLYGIADHLLAKYQRRNR